ncbi:MAG: DUF4384 domain-containing protein [Desulfomonilaceae bacterium]|jgi:hypothetical protein
MIRKVAFPGSLLVAVTCLIFLTATSAASATYEDVLALAGQIRNDNPGINVNIWTEDQRSAYQVGDKIVFNFTVDKDCYLTLIDIGTDGQVLILFPNKFDSDNKIQGGQQYRIPPQGSEYAFRLNGPANRVERVKAIASLDSVLANAPALQQELRRPVEQEPGGGTFITIKNKEQVLSDILAALNNIDTSKWSTAEVSFMVLDASAAPSAPGAPAPSPGPAPPGR